MGAPKSVLRFFRFKNISQSCGAGELVCVCVCVWGGVACPVTLDCNYERVPTKIAL